jgi:hypothetical protein
VDELHTSDEGASNVNPRVRNLVTTRVMYYIFLRPVLDFFYDRNDLHKISKNHYLVTTVMHYFSRWFHCIGIVFEICQHYILGKGFNVVLFFPIHKFLINTRICREISLAPDCWLEF